MVTWENYEEYLLLYADRELDEAQERALLAFVKEHPELEDELQSYLDLRLEPDTAMVFPDKSLLLRSERPAARRIRLNSWWAYSAAAGILLAAVVWGGRLLDGRDIRRGHQPAVLAQQPINAPAIPQATAEVLVVPEAEVAAPEPVQVVVKKPEGRTEVPVRRAIDREEEVLVSLSPGQPMLFKEEMTPAFTEVALVSLPEVVLPGDEPQEREEFLAWLPVNKEKKKALEHIGGHLGNTIDQAKNLKSSFKETAVALKFGNKEFVVNF